MSGEFDHAEFVSATILDLYGEVAKITGASNPPPNLRVIGVAIVLARALESIVNLVTHQHATFPEEDIRAGAFAASARKELFDAISNLERDDDSAPSVYVAVLMKRAISAIDLLLGDRAAAPSVDSDPERAEHILVLTTEVFGGAESAGRWLRAPSMQFDGLRPLDLLTSRQGARMVVTHLTG